MACCWYPSSRGQVNRLESELELLQNSVPLDQFDTVPVELDSLTAGSQLYESVGEFISALCVFAWWSWSCVQRSAACGNLSLPSCREVRSVLRVSSHSSVSERLGGVVHE